ncbi:MAG: YczE/YyaS/YitT family protein [Ilumatobacteraceae bacterium]
MHPPRQTRQPRARRVTRRVVAAFPVRRVRRAAAVSSRVCLVVAGATLIGTGAAVTLWTGLGAGPMDVLTASINARSGLALPFVVWIVAGTLMAVATLIGRRPGLGTFLSPLIVGPVIGAVRSLLDTVPAPVHLGSAVAWHLAGVATIGLGAGALIVAGLGTGTGELLAGATARRTGRREHHIRAGFEVTWLTIGMLLGGPVGFGTVIVAILIGPAVANGSRVVDRATSRPVSRIRAAWATDNEFATAA